MLIQSPRWDEATVALEYRTDGAIHPASKRVHANTRHALEIFGVGRHKSKSAIHALGGQDGVNVALGVIEEARCLHGLRFVNGLQREVLQGCVKLFELGFSPG